MSAALATEPDSSPPPKVRGLDYGDRPPLHSGHPASWRAITKGTTLEGVRYPGPPYTVRHRD